MGDAASETARILLLEDNPDDAELILRELRRGGIRFRVEHVESRDAFLAGLERGEFDLILADYNLPGFDGLSALRLLRQRDSRTPFIFISGTLEGERPIELMREGATDYVLKDRMERLPHAVGRALAEVRERDLLQRTRAALEESEERFRLVIRATTDTIYDWDVRTGAVWWNENLHSMFGYRPDEVGPTVAWRDERIHPDDRERIVDSLRQALEDRGNRWMAEYRFRRGDGKYAEVLDRGYVVHDASGRAQRMVGSLFDVTAIKSLQEQFLQSQKMEAVGRLAGGVAHDFNNLLTVINGYTQMLLSRLDVKPDERAALEEILNAGERAASLTRQLLSLTRKQVVAQRPLDVGRVVGGLEKMLSRILGEDVSLEHHSPPGLWKVYADPTQVEQVILNLSVNARDAMPKGGKLRIESSNVTVDEARGKPPGPYVCLAVRDTGAGMDEATRARLFEPFFTTKSEGKGTGLGLSTVDAIVRQSGGFIEVESAPGKGSTFRIYLPRTHAPEEAAAARGPGGPPPRGTETILLAEDSHTVRRLVREILALNGYGVLEAGNGVEAFNLFARRAEPVHLVITDVVMPLMGGPELVRRVKEKHPRLKVLYISGYTDNPPAEVAPVAGEVDFLQKPFSAEALLGKIRGLLDRP